MKIKIIVEGHTDKDFIESYLTYLELKIKQNIDFEQSGGKDNLKSLKSGIDKAINQGYRIKIIFDADRDLSEARENIKNQLGEETYSKCEIFLLPNDQDHGNLETLFEQIAKKGEVLRCFDQHCDCLKKLQDKQNKEDEPIRLPVPKTKAYAYMHTFGFKNGGENLKLDRIFEFESKALKPLKEFLSQ